jgi:hypothetical protein
LAREALGSDMGVAPTTEEAMLAEPTADTLENLTAAQTSAPSHPGALSDSSNPINEDLADNDQLVPTEFAAAPQSLHAESGSAVSSHSPSGAPATGSAPGSSDSPSPHRPPSDEEFLREREVESTDEGMPSGELDEEPPKADSASAGE